MRASAIFEGMESEEILSVLDCMSASVLRAKRGETVLHAGDSTGRMGILLSGSLLIAQEDVWGRRNIMTKITPGDSFAESYAAAKGSVLSISASANEDCGILWLDIEKMLTVCPTACPHHTHMIRNLVSVLARKNLMFSEKITHMSRRTTREKLLSYLSAEATRHGSLTFDIPYDRQQLADFLCVERAAMSAELSKLRKEGCLETDRSHFTLLTDTRE